MNRITRLYPQYQRSQDRRQRSIPVAIERRSGTDRRSNDRVALDSQLTRDIFEVKSKIAKIESLTPKFFEANVMSQAPSFSSKMTHDILVKQTKPDMTTQAKEDAKQPDKASTAFQVGIIAAALTCAFGLSFLSSAGAVIALGTALYIGARVLKTVIAREVSDKEKDE